MLYKSNWGMSSSLAMDAFVIMSLRRVLNNDAAGEVSPGCRRSDLG